MVFLDKTTENGIDDRDSSTFAKRNGNPPMIHISKDILKEFMSAIPTSSNSDNSTATSNDSVENPTSRASHLFDGDSNGAVKGNYESDAKERSQKRARLESSAIDINALNDVNPSASNIVPLSTSVSSVLSSVSSSISVTTKGNGERNSPGSPNGQFLEFTQVSPSISLIRKASPNSSAESEDLLSEARESKGIPPPIESFSDLEKRISGSVSIAHKCPVKKANAEEGRLEEDELLKASSPCSDISLSLEESLLRDDSAESELPEKTSNGMEQTKNTIGTTMDDVQKSICDNPPKEAASAEDTHITKSEIQKQEEKPEIQKQEEKSEVQKLEDGTKDEKNSTIKYQVISKKKEVTSIQNKDKEVLILLRKCDLNQEELKLTVESKEDEFSDSNLSSDSVTLSGKENTNSLDDIVTAINEKLDNSEFQNSPSSASRDNTPRDQDSSQLTTSSKSHKESSNNNRLSNSEKNKPAITSALTFTEALKSLDIEDPYYSATSKPIEGSIASEMLPSLTLPGKPDQPPASRGKKRSLDKLKDGNKLELKKSKGDSRYRNKARRIARRDPLRIDDDDILDESSNDSSQIYVDVDHKLLEERAKLELGNSKSMTAKKLQKITRNDLESLVLELFIEKVLYEHDLGQQRDLCKRLETTLETNRKKAAQFHKEVEDLKKVTQRLQSEHNARKGQVVAPVKVKRSVGIQATPAIINKGLMHSTTAGSNVIKLIIPSKAAVEPPAAAPVKANQVSDCNSCLQIPTTITATKPTPVTSSFQLFSNINQVLARNNVTIAEPIRQPPPPPRVMPTHLLSLPTKPPIQTAQTLMVNSNQIVLPQGTVSSQIVPMPLTATRFVRAPVNQIATSITPVVSLATAGGIIQPALTTSTAITATTKCSLGSGIIDLTDDEEAGKSGRMASSNILTQGTMATVSGVPGQLVIPHSSALGQLFLLQPNNGQPAQAVVVGNMATNPSPISGGAKVTTIRPNILPNSSLRLTAPAMSPGAIMNSTRLFMGSQMNAHAIQPISQHPAPLPKAPPQQTSGLTKKLPTKPILKLSHKDGSIILSWNMLKTDDHERISSYQLYAYQEGQAPPVPTLWKKVGSVKALELPMACTLTQFMPGHVYHFAVRGVDIRTRLGPFSEPRSIRLAK